MPVPLTEKSVREFAESWATGLDQHMDFTEAVRYVVDQGLEMTFPEGVFREIDGFAKWYDTMINRYFDEQHTFIEVRPDITGDRATVKIKVNWQARMWQPPAATSTWLGFDVDQTWQLVAGEVGPLLKTYVVEHLEPMPGSGSL